jgi:hypothetical protein
LLPITVNTTATFDPSSTLQMQLDANWGSKINFASGFTPSLAGTLDLEFAPAVDPLSLVGQSFQLFVWNAPLDPANRFTNILTDPRATFDLSGLYTTGTITLTAAPEPGTFVPLVLGLAGLLIPCRRTRRATGPR